MRFVIHNFQPPITNPESLFTRALSATATTSLSAPAPLPSSLLASSLMLFSCARYLPSNLHKACPPSSFCQLVGVLLSTPKPEPASFGLAFPKHWLSFVKARQSRHPHHQKCEKFCWQWINARHTLSKGR